MSKRRENKSVVRLEDLEGLDLGRKWMLEV